MIDTDRGLACLVPRLNAAEWVALDTEADSLHAYPEKLCLVQLSWPGEHALIDPLSGIELAPLWEALWPHELILHGADYDLRLLNRGYGFVPRLIFDTMEAARLLGCGEFGLIHLVAEFLGVALEKGPQKADWARRPLTEPMETYARNDTRYLKPLADILRQELRRKGRLSWHQETCRRLVADCAILRVPDPESVWRIKGSHRLDPRGLAVLRELWFWREQEAVRANKPPFFILSHETLVALAAAAARSLPVEPLLPARLSARRRDGLAAAVCRGLQLSPLACPKIVRATQRHPDPAERRRFEELKRKRDHQAAQLGIDPTLIASRARLEGLAQDWGRSQQDLMAWQRELLG